jgi:hypothetical protein
MKKLLLIPAALCLITISLVLTGCGQSTGSTTAATSAASSSCSSGYVYSSTYGCLLQSSCASGYGLYNGTCVYTGTTTTSGSCVSIYQSIPFYGTGVSIDSYGDLYGGTIPNYSTYGSIIVGSSTSVSGTTYSGETSTYATLQMAVPSYSSTTTTITGSLSLTSYAQQAIVSDASSSGYGTSSTPCVSGMAIYGRLYSSYFTGYVFLYINGTQHGVELSF